MKHAHTLKRAMAVVLALVLTLSLVTPTWAMSSSSVATKGENNGITWEKVDNIKLPIKENAAVEEDAQQQYADTDVVRVSIVLSDPSTLDKGFSASDIASGSKLESDTGHQHHLRQRSVWPDREDREDQGC